MHRQTAQDVTSPTTSGTVTVNLYQFQLFITQKPIHAKLSPHNTIIAKEHYPAACA